MGRGEGMKIDRVAIHTKYNGRCAYCGVSIHIKDMQVDHIEPLHRGRTISTEERMRLSHINNLNPTCRPCNYRKRTHSIEEYRAEIGEQVNRLRRDSNPFELAEKFGLVKETGKAVVFYFETMKGGKE